VKASLHSRYNPQGEAERYLSTITIPPRIRCFILIEPGLGYLIPVLARRFPGAGILVLHAEAPSGEGFPQDGGAALSWDPSLPLPAEQFLEQELENLAFSGDSAGSFGAESIKIIEWRPSRDFYGERYVKLLAAAAAAIRRFDAEQRTLRVFGRRWFRNFFKNLRFRRYFPVCRELPLPAVVTGAGPSLEESLDTIGKIKKQKNCFIIAASSSAMALLRRGIAPDLVLSTDGGGWALLHLYELFRGAGLTCTAGNTGNQERPRGLAASFTAGLPSQCGALPILWISDGSLWQTLVLKGLGIPHLVLPQRGTVTATAVDLALILCRGEVGIAGMDLGARDIRTHARPYSFDRLWRDQSSRLRSEYSQRFFRRMAMEEGGSYRIYAEWFSAQLASYPGRLRGLGNNNPLFAGLPPMGAGGPASAEPPPCTALPCMASPCMASPVTASPETRETAAGGDPVFRALGILKAGLEDKKLRDSLARELGPLLLPGGPGEKAGLWAEIEALARPYLPSSLQGAFHA
jgi:hypothetical protein